MLDLMPWRKPKRREAMPAARSPRWALDRFWVDDFWPGEDLLDSRRWTPQVDISEGSREITVRADIPGIDAKALDVSLDGRRLTIRGEKKSKQESREDDFFRLERSYGSFSRTIELPAEVVPDAVDASCRNGVLKIRLKKAKPSESKRITVKAG